MQAADAFAHDRDRETLRRLRPVRDALPDAPTVRELNGLAEYRVGNYRAAAKELEAFVELTDSAEQHPVLMDCYRAQRRWKRRSTSSGVSSAATSPSADARGRRPHRAGRIARRSRPDRRCARHCSAARRRRSRSPSDYHLRLWYALGDLEERAGNISAARDLFQRVRRHDPDFADVTARAPPCADRAR